MVKSSVLNTIGLKVIQELIKRTEILEANTKIK